MNQVRIEKDTRELQIRLVVGDIHSYKASMQFTIEAAQRRPLMLRIFAWNPSNLKISGVGIALDVNGYETFKYFLEKTFKDIEKRDIVYGSDSIITTNIKALRGEVWFQFPKVETSESHTKIGISEGRKMGVEVDLDDEMRRSLKIMVREIDSLFVSLTTAQSVPDLLFRFLDPFVTR